MQQGHGRRIIGTYQESQTAAHNYFAVLNVSEEADTAEIQQHYHLLMLYVYHPDRYMALPEPQRRILLEHAHRQSCLLNDAYRTLTTPSLRAAYCGQRQEARGDRVAIVFALLRQTGTAMRHHPNFALSTGTSAFLLALWLLPALIVQPNLLIAIIGGLVLTTVGVNLLHYAGQSPKGTHGNKGTSYCG